VKVIEGCKVEVIVGLGVSNGGTVKAGRGVGEAVAVWEGRDVKVKAGDEFCPGCTTGEDVFGINKGKLQLTNEKAINARIRTKQIRFSKT